MTKNTVAALHSVLVPLSTIVGRATRTARIGKRVRAYTELTALYENSPVTGAVAELLRLGTTVKVYRGTFIFTPSLNTDGSLNWGRARNSCKDREGAVVEVTL